MTCFLCGSADIQRRGVRRGKQRYHCNECRRHFSVEAEPVEPTFEVGKAEKATIEKHDRYIITCAQNNTPVQPDFWAAVERYASETGAKLIVIPVRYRNPTAPGEYVIAERETWWPYEVEPYLVEGELKLHPKLWMLGDVRVQATAQRPLSGLEALSGPASAIIGHSQIAMQTIPTPQQRLPKQMYTTGSVSLKNYSRTKTGKVGWLHHSLGALVVEKEDGRFHVRVVNGDSDNAFYDLRTRYAADGVSSVDRIPGIVLGDEHVTWLDPDVTAATFGEEQSLVSELRPEVIVRHDVLDNYSISHWHDNDPIQRFAKWRYNLDGLEAELAQAVEHINSTTPPKTENVVVASNHHDWLLRWLNRADPKKEPWNALVYHELMYRMLKETKLTEFGPESPDPFALWAEGRLKVPARFLRPWDSYSIKNILISLHGDYGNNGGRGSPGGLSKIGAKTVIGHSHSPCIHMGCYQVGTSTKLRLWYSSKGASSWLNTHCLILPNGKRQLVSVIDGCWRLWS